MKLYTAVTQYVNYRKSLGEKFRTNEGNLKAFVRFIGQEKNLKDVQPKQINEFLMGKGSITASWFGKHQALRGFYNYILSRGYTKEHPLPIVIPKRPQPFVPYIYSSQELIALLDACYHYQRRRVYLEPYMVRTILLLLYGAGLRISEAINLTLADVDLPQGLLIIRETKFRKTRLVPLGEKLTQVLSQYKLKRQRKGYAQNAEAPFFVGRNGKAVNEFAFEYAFRRIRQIAGVKRTDNARYQPRLHDLRHTFAVHRLTQWYKEGADVQELLPMLSVYMGHVCLEATSVYLTMTPALLNEAGNLFQQYAFKESSHD